ncbi:MAG: peptidoglycan-binding protein [Candidatus Cloacimonetes bacterium]|nr:peptidoglycan-binding protein [Candidatus Cloacimonadota bacterium]
MTKFVLTLLFICSLNLFSQNITNPKKILNKIDKIISEEYELNLKNISYPPDCTVIRVFKEERECEIWAKDSQQDSLNLIMTLPVGSMDFAPGPKLKQGDCKTPEGFYYGNFAYYSSNWFMWIDLNNVEKSGKVGKGSAFRICLNYPNEIDRQHTQKAGFNNTGGAICVHGNSVSIGCVSLENKDFAQIYAFSKHHNSSKYGRVQFHVFPFRFENKTVEEKELLCKQYIHIKNYSTKNLLRLWKNLEFGYNLFNNNKKPLTIITNRKYMQENDLSENIIIIKKFLKEMVYYEGNIDFRFCANLKKAIEQYQKEKGVIADGIIGKETISILKNDGLVKISIEYIFVEN